MGKYFLKTVDPTDLHPFFGLTFDLIGSPGFEERGDRPTDPLTFFERKLNVRLLCKRKTQFKSFLSPGSELLPID